MTPTNTETDTAHNPQDVLAFWFPDDGAPDLALWFGGSTEIDADIRARFADVHAAAAGGELDHWADTPEGAVALVVVLDQLSRNLHRGDMAMFAYCLLYTSPSPRDPL